MAFDLKTRTLEQNAILWCRLRDLSAQVPWWVDGRKVLLDPDEWKQICSAALRKHQRLARGIEGGWVMLGVSTRRMTKDEMGLLLDLIQAFGDQRGVKWTAVDQ